MEGVEEGEEEGEGFMICIKNNSIKNSVENDN